MNPRQRRLLADLGHMQDVSRDGSIDFRSEGDPPELYELMFAVPGLALDENGEVVVRQLHRCRAYLHLDYPRRPPLLTWQTPVFHPNLLPPAQNGGVCIGAWSPSESLADLCRRLEQLVTWQTFNTTDALNTLAAEWADRHDVQPGHDLSALEGMHVAPEPEIEVRFA